MEHSRGRRERAARTTRRECYSALYPGIIEEWPEDRDSPVEGPEYMERFQGSTPWKYLVQREDQQLSPNDSNT